MGLLVSTGLHIRKNQHANLEGKLTFSLPHTTFPFVAVNQGLLPQQDEEEPEEISLPTDRSLEIFPPLNDSLISSAVEIVAQQRLAERLENLLSSNSPLNDLDSSLFSGTDSENQEYFFHSTTSPLPDVSFRPTSVVEAQNRQVNNRGRLANYHVDTRSTEQIEFDSLKELFNFLLSTNQIRLDNCELICSRTLNTMYLQPADSLDESSSDMDFESSEIHHSLMWLHALQSASLSGIRHMLPIGKVPQCQSFSVSSWPLLQQTFKNVLYDIQMRTNACYCDDCTVIGPKRTFTNTFSNAPNHSSDCPYPSAIVRPDASGEGLVLPSRILGPQMLAKLRSARTSLRTPRGNCCPYMGGSFDGNRAILLECGDGRKRTTARAAFRAAEERKSQLFNWHMAKAEYAAIHEPHLVDLLRARECGTTLGSFRRRRCGRILRSGTTRLGMEAIHGGRFTAVNGDDKVETKMRALPGSAEVLSRLSTENKRGRNKCAVTEAIKDAFGRFSFHCNCTGTDGAANSNFVGTLSEPSTSAPASNVGCKTASNTTATNASILGNTKPPKHDGGVLLTGSADLLWRGGAHRSRPSAFTIGQRAMIGNRFLPNQRRVIDSIKAKTFCISYLDNGDGVLTASQDQQIRIYKARGRHQRYLLERNIQVPLIGWSILDVVVSPDGRHLVYSTWNEAMYQYDLHNPSDNWQQLRVDPREERFALFSLRFNADGSEIVAGSSDQHVYIYNREVGRCVLAAQAHEDDVNTVCFGNAASHIILSGGDDGLVKVWDRRTMGDFNDARPVGQFAGHRDGITYIDSRGDDRYLLSNSKDQTVKVWDLRHFATETAVNVTKRAVGSQKWDYRWQCSPLENLMEDNLEGDCSLVTIRGHSVLHTLIRARFSPEHTGKRYIYTGCGRGNCVVYDFLTCETARVYTGHASVVRDCAWHPTRNEIITSSWDGKTHLWRYDQREAANGARVVDGDRLFDAKCYGVALDESKKCFEDDEDERSCDESYREQPLYHRADGWQRRLRKRFVRRAGASNTRSSSSSDDEIMVENTSDDDDEEAVANQGAQSGGLEVDPVSVARRPTPINSYAAAAKRGKQRRGGRS